MDLERTAEAAVSDASASEAIRTSRQVLLLRAVGLVVTLAGSLALARTLGPEARGAHGFFAAGVVILSLLLSLSVGVGGYVSILHSNADARAIARNIPWIAAIVGAVAALLTAAARAAWPGAMPSRLDEVHNLELLVFLAVGSFVASTQYLQLALAVGRPLAAALLSFGPYTFAAIGYVGTGLIGGSLELALWCFAAGPAVVLIVGALVPRPLVSIVLGRPNLGLVRETIRNGLRTYVGDIAASLLQRSDVVLLGILSSGTAVGLYVVSYQTAEPLLVIASATTVSILAVHPGSATAGSADFTTKVVRDSVSVIAGLALVSAIVAPLAIPALFGSAFTGSVGPFLVLLPGIVAFGAGRLALAELARRNLLERSAAILFAGFGANLALNVVLIPSLGTTGAAIASTVAYVGVAVVATFVVARGLRVPASGFVPSPSDVLTTYAEIARGMLRASRRSHRTRSGERR